MIKLTVADSLDKVCDFIDNRLILLMSEKKLRQLNPGVGLQVLFKEKYRIKNIDNTVLYIEKESKKATLVISTIEKKGDKVKSERYGMTIRNKDENTLEIYIDTLAEAFKKGIISNDVKRKIFTMKSVAIALACILLIGIISVTGGLALFGLFILAVILYPIQYLLNKRMFKRTQEKMRKLVLIFEEEFNVKNKLDTNDWISFWGQIKSDIKDEIKDSLPFSYR